MYKNFDSYFILCSFILKNIVTFCGIALKSIPSKQIFFPIFLEEFCYWNFKKICKNACSKNVRKFLNFIAFVTVSDHSGHFSPLHLFLAKNRSNCDHTDITPKQLNYAYTDIILWNSQIVTKTYHRYHAKNSPTENIQILTIQTSR